VELTSEAASLNAKLEYLRSSHERIVTRSVLEKVLFELYASPDLGGDQSCARCGSKNPSTNHFCAYCAQRLGEDRTDLSGSWEEIAEINYHHAVFSDGMKSCQEIIGLVRGLGSGLDNFEKSVSDMCATERRYPLPKLRIEVPFASMQYGKSFDHLERTLQSEQSVHPLQFARQARAYIDETFTEEKIQRYFETMGQELSRQAEAQWD
jgi:hypothetical protein